MSKPGPTNVVARLLADEILSDPRAEHILDLCEQASGLLRSFDKRRPPSGREAHLRNRIAELEAALTSRLNPSPRAQLLFDDNESINADLVRKRRASLAKLCHPDRGFSASVMAEINQAADALLLEIKEEKR